MEQNQNENKQDLKKDLFRLKEKINFYNKLLQDKENLIDQLKEVNKEIKETEHDIIKSEQKIRIRTNKT